MDPARKARGPCCAGSGDLVVRSWLDRVGVGTSCALNCRRDNQRVDANRRARGADARAYEAQATSRRLEGPEIRRLQAGIATSVKRSKILTRPPPFGAHERLTGPHPVRSSDCPTVQPTVAAADAANAKLCRLAPATGLCEFEGADVKCATAPPRVAKVPCQHISSCGRLVSACRLQPWSAWSAPSQRRCPAGAAASRVREEVVAALAQIRRRPCERFALTPCHSLRRHWPHCLH